MKKIITVMFFLVTVANYLKAQETSTFDTTAESSPVEISESVESLPERVEAPDVAENNAKTQQDPPALAKGLKSVLSNVQWGATVDMQVDKEMWDEFGQDSKNRVSYPSLSQAYRRVMDDFWLRVSLRGMYSQKNFESAFALRFYPYWTMRRKGVFQYGTDLERYLDVLEINQAYLKVFKDHVWGDNKIGLHCKIGRDGLLSTGSQLFGNYLELPTAGYGESRSANIVGPFKNRKVFSNMLEIGFSFNLGEMVSGKTSLMIGGNVNNQKWYSAPVPSISEEMDSRLSAGFTRGYQDFYFWKERIHLGGGFRVYTTKISTSKTIYFTNELGNPDSTTPSFADDSKYVNGDWTFDITFFPEFKFYSEFGFQKLGSGSSKGIIRPFTAGITIPTGGVLDVLAIEIENVSKTFFSSVSMRDPVGNRKDTKSFAWGIVTEKWFIKERLGVAWGLYTGNAYGDMKTSLRLTSNL